MGFIAKFTSIFVIAIIFLLAQHKLLMWKPSEIKLTEIIVLNQNVSSDIKHRELRIHDFQDKAMNPGKKLILHWSGWYKPSADAWRMKHLSTEDCVHTNNHSQFEKADAIIFHFYPTSWPQDDLPLKRHKFQYYVAWINEHADFWWIRKKLRDLPKDFINISMTYRLDSHIPLTYMSTKKLNISNRSRTNRSIKKILKEAKMFPKKKSVAWLVSHCKTTSDRESYVKELQKYIDVDIYGACGLLKCGSRMSKECYEMIERNYKFYLSFENSVCKDYVTEKLQTILNYNIIPITLGGANYSHIAPPHSFINALEFKSPKMLANYLKSLESNWTNYLKYFEWKARYKVLGYSSNIKPAFNKLCAILHKGQQYNYYKDFLEWWFPTDVCKEIKFIF